MARRCIFCPDEATEYDHAIPAWIPRHLKQTQLLLDHVQANNVVRRKHLPFKDYKGKIVCAPCNRHFGRLEERVKPHLVPMLDGQPIEHDEATRAMLSEWALKMTCALLGIERKRRAVPQGQRFALRERGTVPVSTQVGVGRYTAGGIRIFAGRLRLVPGRGVAADPTLSVYHSMAAFGQVVFKVFGVLKPPPEDTFRVPVGRLYQVWPPKHDTVRWPPLWGLDDREIDEFAVFNSFVRR